MSPTDPLAKFRRTSTAQTAADAKKTVAAQQSIPGKAYEAYKAADTPQQRLWLRCRSTEPDRAPAYCLLADVITDGRDVISLVFTTKLVEIYGRNLAELFLLLLGDRVEWIQVFEAGKWEAEPTGDQPVITDIQVHTSSETFPPAKSEMN